MQRLPGWVPAIRKSGRQRNRSQHGRRAASRIGQFIALPTDPLSPAARWRRPVLELLEDRAMLTGYFGDVGFLQVAEKVAGDQGTLKSISDTLHAVDMVTQIPLINMKVNEISNITNSIENFRHDLYDKIKSLETALNGLNDTQAAEQISRAIAEVLGPDGARVLANRDAVPGTIDWHDVNVVLNSTSHSIDVSMNLGFTTDQFDSSRSMDTGVDSIPFQPAAGESGKFTVSLVFQNFNFGYNPSDGLYFQHTPAQLQFALRGYLPTDTFTVGLGFLNFQATDLTPNTPTNSDLLLTLTSNVGPNGIDAPQLGGSLSLHTHLLVQADLEGVPELQTDFIFDWGFGTGLASNTPMGAGWGAPTLRFDYVQMSVGSMLGNLVKPIAHHVKEVMEPLEPLFDLLEKPIPGLDDISRDVGGPTINLLFLVKNVPEVLPTPLLNAVRSIETLRDYYSKIKTLSGLSGWLNLGSFTISSPSGNFLTDFAYSQLGSLAGNWSDLFSPDGGVNFDGIKSQLRGLLGDDFGGQVADIFDKFTQQDEKGGIKFSYPIVTNTKDVALGMLLGQDKDLVSAEVTLDFTFEKTVHIKIIPGFSVFLEGLANFHAYAGFGYDTHGLRQAMKPLYEGGSFDAAATVDGFWLSPQTRIEATGGMHIGPEIDIEVVKFNVNGGFTLDLHALISNSKPRQDPNKIRPFSGDLGDRLFSLNGKMQADVNLHLEVGVDVPLVGFVGYQNTWTLASAPVFQFDTDHVDIPGELVAPPPADQIHLFRYDFNTLTLYLNAGDLLSNRNIGDNITNEKFVVKHVDWLPFFGVHLDTYDITAFGITQRFQGFVENFVAELGTGEDSLKIIDDDYSGVLYQLYGGSGNDVIDVEGHVDAQLHGDEGNDTLNAGSGYSRTFLERPTTIHGGPGNDKVTFGNGLVENMTAAEQFLLIRDDPFDNSLDTITFDNSKSRKDWFYEFQQDTYPGYDKILSLDGSGALSEQRNIHLSKHDAVTIKSGYGNDTFTGFPTTFSQLYGGGGNDHFNLKGDNTGLPLGSPPPFLPFLGFPYVSINGGDGLDDVHLWDPRTEAPVRTFELNANHGAGASASVKWTQQSDTSTQGFIVYSAGMEATNLETTLFPNNNQLVNVNGWDAGDLSIDAASVSLAADDSMVWDTNIAIHNTIQLRFVGGLGNHLAHPAIDANGPYFVLQNNHRVNLSIYPETPLYFFEDAYTTVDMSPQLLFKTWGITFTNGKVDFLAPATAPGATPVDYNYRLQHDLISVNSKSFFLEGDVDLVLNGEAGNDQFKVLSYPLGVQAQFFGGAGTDNMLVDLRADAADHNLTVTPDVVAAYHLISGFPVIDMFASYDTNVESLKVFGGAGKDQIRVDGNFDRDLTVDGGDNDDTIEVGDNGFLGFTSFAAPTLIAGGLGDDTFQWKAARNLSDGPSYAAAPVTIDGGDGKNLLSLEDAARANGYQIYADRFKVSRSGFGLGIVNYSNGPWADIPYTNIDNLNVIGDDDLDDRMEAFSTSARLDAGGLVFDGNGGNDQYIVHLHDALANRDLTGLFNIFAGAGNDMVTVDNSGATAAGNYRLTGGLFGFVAVDGLGPSRLNIPGDLEHLEIKAGSAADTFQIDSFPDSPALAIAAGGGDDTFEMGSVGQSVESSFFSGFKGTFDGEDGIDSFNLHNESSSTAWSYTNNLAGISAAHLGLAPLSFNPVRVENVSVAGGTAPDHFQIDSLASGQTLSLNGGGGRDSFDVTPTAGLASAIQGQLSMDGAADGGLLQVLDTANTAGATLHIEGTSEGLIGSAPGDTLFGAGSSVRYRNLGDPLSTGDVTITLGSGADTIYATPQTTNSLNINAGSPTAGVGDRLNLDLSQAQSPAVQDQGGGSGQFTSANAKPVSWTGVETLNSAYIAPRSFFVVNTLDSGPGSLRQALLDANASANVGGPDLIRFAVPGAYAHTIQPLSPLPEVTDSVVIDAATQPGYAGKPIIELDGSLSGPNAHGLYFSSSGNTVRGLAINRFIGTPNGGIHLYRSSDNVIQGNYLGTNLAGDAVFSDRQQNYGVILFGGDNNVIGTDGDGINDVAEGNVISGQNTAGILIEGYLPTPQTSEYPDNNIIAGNRIGTSADGNTALGNGRMGIFILSGGTGNRIGVVSDRGNAAERNTISGNPEAGIFSDSSETLIAGNYIGVNAAGNAPVPNGDGIRISGGSNNVVGGAETGAGNIIAFNTYTGVQIDAGAANRATTGNSVLGNAFFSNGRLGINLSGGDDPLSFVTANDATDSDSGPNNLQNFPQLSTAIGQGNSIVVGGSLQSTPNTRFHIEFFISPAADPSGYGEGQIYLGSSDVTSDASGLASVFGSLLASSPLGQFITATATDAAGNTSEFSAGVQVVASLSNVAVLYPPGSSQPYLITSPTGTSISASVTATPPVAPPNGIIFPFGLVDFTVTGVTPGAATTVTLIGVDLSQAGNYYKYGPTPDNSDNHWYNYRYTPTGRFAGTGMEIVGGNVVLHLIDGGRGDDDLAANGSIDDIGGPAPVLTTTTLLVSNHIDTSTYGEQLTFTATVSAASGTPTGKVQFKVDGHKFGWPQSLVGGTASFNSPTLSATDHVIQALYSSDSDAFTSSDDDYTQHVDRALLTIIAEDKTKAYGASLPALTADYMGFVNNENSSVLTKKAKLTTTATAASHAGAYPITASGAAAANYTIAYQAGQLSVTPVALKITVDNKSKVYGAAMPTLTASYSGFVNGDTPSSLTTKPTLSTSASAASHVSTYPITAAGAADSDYTISYQSGTLNVTPAILTIKADDKTKVAGSANPPLTFTAIGLVNGDTAASLSQQPVLTTTATTSSPAGSYPITASGAASIDYAISYGTGRLTVTTPPATVKGRAYFDVTGNGLTADDTPLSSVRVYIDANNNGVWNTNEPSALTLTDGTYALNGLSAGSYKIRQVAPAEYVQTSPATSDYYSVTVAAGQIASGNDFADAILGDVSFLSNVAYVINGTTPVSDLRGFTKEGDTVQVTFTIAAGTQPQRLTLVAYTAPGPAFDPNTAAQQRIFDVDAGVFGPGTYTLNVSNPHSYFQVDFVGGYAIDQFGASGSNITYSAQNRLISADNGGTHSLRSSPASLTGFVYCDANNNGIFDSGERPIAGATVSLTGAATQKVVTDAYGAYTFDNLPSGSYTVTETQPGDYTDGLDSLGNKGGSKANDKFTGITLSANAAGSGYNFGEQQAASTAFASNQTQSAAWWNGASGQTLIKALNGGQSAKNLGNWLATNFNNLFGAVAGSSNDLTGKTNAQVATYYQSLYANSGKAVEVQALALALSVYVTNSNLAGSTASSYGFAVSTGGLGSATASVGASGAAFGVNNDAVMTIAELLSRTNARARKGLIWDTDNSGSLSPAENILRDQVGAQFASINNA